MNVSVTITLCVCPGEKHWRQMQEAAAALTDSKSSIRISRPDDDSKKLNARFTVPRARQEDIVDHIGRRFWYVEDYSDSAIAFSSRLRPPRRRRTMKRNPAC